MNKLYFFIFCDDLLIFEGGIYIGNEYRQEFNSNISHHDDSHPYDQRLNSDWSIQQFFETNYIGFHDEDINYIKFEESGLLSNDIILSISEYVIFAKDIRGDKIHTEKINNISNKFNNLELIKISKINEDINIIQSFNDFNERKNIKEHKKNNLFIYENFINDKGVLKNFLIILELIRLNYSKKLFQPVLIDFNINRILQNFPLLSQFKKENFEELFYNNLWEFIGDRKYKHPLLNGKVDKEDGETSWSDYYREEIIEDIVNNEIKTNLEFLKKFLDIFKTEELFFVQTFNQNRYLILKFQITYININFVHLFLTFEFKWEIDYLSLNTFYEIIGFEDRKFGIGYFGNERQPIGNELKMYSVFNLENTEKFIETLTDEISNIFYLT